jgi:hypothetical protein
MVDGASILDFAPGPQKVRNGPDCNTLRVKWVGSKFTMVHCKCVMSIL